MEQIVYIDIIFVENFLINFLLIHIVSRYCHSKTKKWRITISALLGGAYVIFAFIVGDIFFGAAVKIGVSLFMVLIAFGYHDVKQFLRKVVLFYIAAFIFSGAILAAFYMTNASVENVNGVFVIRDMKYWHLILGGILANFMVKIGFDYLDRHYRAISKNVMIKLTMFDKSVKIKALVDTGNSLRDPITGKPVLVVYEKALAELLPNIQKESILNENNNSAFRMIPYTALGVENGKLPSIIIDSLEIVVGKETKKTYKPVIALYDKPLSSLNNYDAIAYPELLYET